MLSKTNQGSIGYVHTMKFKQTC